ncbi:hypothetical protein F4604DRAFT_1589498 [Suillus subluteus]|nr:hypothetical protein F4604DRAFT_1589498 [Suillus subluteus]
MPIKFSAPGQVGRYPSVMRKLTTSNPRTPWHHRKKTHHTSTPAEKAVLKQKRAEHNAGYREALENINQMIMDQATELHAKFRGHNIEYYYREILQSTRRTKNKHSLSRWNAFVRQEMKHINDGIPQGENRHKAAQHAAEISARWKGMTKEEREAATEGAMTELAEQCESKALAPHNVPLNSFQDVNKTLQSIDNQLAELHACTGTEILLIAVHANVDHFNRPHVFQTACTVNFFDSSIGTSVGDVAFHLEGFCISGVKEEVAAPFKVSRMYYQNFNRNITQKYHLVLDNWPLSKFVTPGNINSLTELRVLYNAWDSNATRFRKLSDEEYETWEAKNFADVLASASTLHDADEEDLVAEGETNAPGPQLLSNSVPKSPANPPLQPSDCDASIAAPEPTQTRKRKVPSETPAGSVVFTMDGAPMQVTKKLRRERADKGIKHGPHKKKGDALAVESSKGPSHSTDNTRDLLDAPPRGGMRITL